MHTNMLLSWDTVKGNVIMKPLLVVLPVMYHKPDIHALLGTDQGTYQHL